MRRKIVFVIILVAAIVLATARTLPPRPLPANAPETGFSAGRAVEIVKAIAQSPRLVGSPAFEEAKKYVLANFAAMGLETETQDVSIEGVKVENSLARLPGKASNQAILLVAHLDSVAEGPGAMDDASGVAAVLETMRALSAGPTPDNTVIALITGPEENCCYGSRAFAKSHPWAQNVRMVVNVDAGGVGGPSILAATGPDEGWLINELAPNLPDPIASSAIEAFGSPATDYTLELRRDGYEGFDFNLAWVKRIHTPLDNIGQIDAASIQHQGEHMLAVARHFGNIPLEYPPVTRPIYFDLLGLTIIHYPVKWAPALFVVSMLVMAWLSFSGFKKKTLNIGGLAFGALAFLLSLVTVPLLLLILQYLIIQPLLLKTPSLGAQLIGDSLLSNSLRWGSTSLAILTAHFWHRLFHRIKRLEWENLAFGAFGFLFVAAGVTSFAFPAISYLFTWPLLAGMLAMLVRFSFNGKKGLQWAGNVAMLAAAIVAILLFVPGIMIALLSIDIRMVYLVPLFVTAFTGFLVLPVGLTFSN